MRDAFILLTILGTVPLIFLRPHVGVLVWAWISYMNPHRLAWSFAYEFRLALVIGLVTLVAWALSKEQKRLELNAISFFLILLTIWILVANLFAIVPEEAWPKVETVIKIMLMTFISMILINSRERVHALVWIIVASLGFYGAKGGVFTLLGGGEQRVWGPANSFIADNNALALALIMTLPLMRYLQLQSKSPYIRWGMLALMGASLFAIIGSHSRGAFVATIPMLFLLVVMSRRRALLFLLAACFLVGAAFFVPDKWIDRMRTIETYEEDHGSAMARIRVWTFAIKLALDRPLTGGGFYPYADTALYFSYVPDAITPRNFHSIYFEVLGELGFVGLGIYLALLLSCALAARRIIARSRGDPELGWANDLARMTLVALAGFCFAGLFQNLAFFDLFQHLIAILFVTDIIVRKKTAATATEPDPGALGLAAYGRPR